MLQDVFEYKRRCCTREQKLLQSFIAIDSFDWEAIRVRGYPITVFCTWGLKYGETFGSPSNTYVDIHDDYHSTAKWGGSPSDEGPSAVLTRYWWYIQLIVDP